MPTISIDTFFACALMVSVAVLATASFVGTMQTTINGFKDVNKENFLRAIADRLVIGYGAPSDWGSNRETTLTGFGLGSNGSSNPYELDIDKVCRLNSLNNFSVSYYKVSQAARLNQIAFGISVSPMLSISVEPVGNVTSGDATTYTFKLSVSGHTGPVSAGLHCYAVAKNYLASVSNETSESGVGYVSIQIPNASNGPAILVAFARSQFDDRLTSCDVYSFAHLSSEPLPNNSILGLSPLNYSLYVNPKNSGTVVEDSYAFSWNYQSNLTRASEDVYSIPAWLDKSPTVLVLCGVNGTSRFAEWVSYPQIPVQFGADFSNSEENVFTYTVMVKENFYLLTVRLGDVVN